MNCDQCDNNEATVHETVIEHGKIVEKHLCEACAAEQGFGVKVAGPVEEIIKKILPGAKGVGLPAGTTRCPSCGMTFADFAQKRLLGCPRCYDVFETQLGVLIEREHEGATHHVGKVPRHARAQTRMVAEATVGGAESASPPQPSLEDELARLRQLLSEAVRREEYEQAAELHKRISELASASDDANDETDS